MMLEHLGHKEAADEIINAFKKVIKDGKDLTPDMGGNSSTIELGQAVCDVI